MCRTLVRWITECNILFVRGHLLVRYSLFCYDICHVASELFLFVQIVTSTGLPFPDITHFNPAFHLERKREDTILNAIRSSKQSRIHEILVRSDLIFLAKPHVYVEAWRRRCWEYVLAVWKHLLILLSWVQTSWCWAPRQAFSAELGNYYAHSNFGWAQPFKQLSVEGNAGFQSRKLMIICLNLYPAQSQTLHITPKMVILASSKIASACYM